MRIRVVDLCCKAGGCSRGYWEAFTRAGHDVEIVGVDIEPQPNYPYTFVQADALTFPLDGFDFIHASPPCQAYSQSSKRYKNAGKQYPDVLVPVRERLIASGKPYIIENVVGAPLINPTQLCGTMFGLQVYRHRLFESNLPIAAPFRCKHPRYLADGYVCVYGGRVRGKQTGNTGNHYETYSVAVGRAAMGIPWMTGKELSQAVPPAYTVWLGAYYVLKHLIQEKREAA